MGLKSLLSDLESFDKNDNSMDAFGFHDTPASSGGFNYGAHAARALGANVAAVTRLNKDDQHVVKNLEFLFILILASKP